MKVANCINLARCQLPAAVSQGSTKTYQMCFTTLVWWDCIGDPIRGLHWRLNPRIALVTQSKDCIGDPIQGLHTCLPTQTADLPSAVEVLLTHFSDAHCRRCRCRCSFQKSRIVEICLFPPLTSKFQSKYFPSIVS